MSRDRRTWRSVPGANAGTDVWHTMPADTPSGPETSTAPVDVLTVGFIALFEVIAANGVSLIRSEVKP
jgi:hypothetical protein